MSAKRETFGSPPEPAIATMPDIRLGIPAPANCWKVRRREDGVEELVPATLMELKRGLHGGEQLAPRAWVVSDWELWK